MAFNMNNTSSPNTKFTSVFHMNGVPILPPLMTDEKRQQMHVLRQKAIEVENKRKQSKEKPSVDAQNDGNKTTPQELCVFKASGETDNTLQSIEDSYMMLSRLVNKQTSQAPILTISDTIIYDNRTNSVILPLTENSGAKYLKTPKIPAINIDPPTPLVPTRTFGDHLDSSYLESGECLSLSHDDSLSSSESDESSAIKRSATSPSLHSIETAFNSEPISPAATSRNQHGLVRSTSFTVATPSKYLLQHLERELREKHESGLKQIKQQPVEYRPVMSTPKKPQQLTRVQKPIICRSAPSTGITRDTVESKAKRVQKNVPKPSPVANPRITKRSPYEQNLSVKLKKNIPQKVKTTPIQPSVSPKPQPSTPQIALPEVQGEKRQQFLKLLALQQEQQRLMQESFEIERKTLLEELAKDAETSDTNHGKFSETSSPNSISMQPSEFCDDSSPISQAFAENMPPPSMSGGSTNRTPRRRLFGPELSPLGLTPRYVNEAHLSSPSISSKTGRRLDPDEKERRTLAATKINAGVRGYLTRRLLHTEHVQRIVQTIRDTLFFVLSLHMESRENPQEGNKLANIQLKTRLLQQLLSATKTFHMVFFELTTKERLEIISRDRKRLKMKLLAELKKQRSATKSPNSSSVSLRA